MDKGQRGKQETISPVNARQYTAGSVAMQTQPYGDTEESKLAGTVRQPSLPPPQKCIYTHKQRLSWEDVSRQGLSTLAMSQWNLRQPRKRRVQAHHPMERQAAASLNTALCSL